MRILIAEDSVALANSLQKAFVAHGYEVDIALTAQAATAAFINTQYDVAVLAYHLPDGAGDALLETFCTQRPECVCIMMTIDPKPELAMDWIKRGAAAYLRKPFEPEYLVELCTRACREQSLMRVKDLLEVRTRELRQKDELLISTQRLAKTGGWEWNVEKQTMVWTDEVYRIHDFEPDEFTPGSPEHIAQSLACYAPDHRSMVAAAFQRCIEQGEPYDLECPFTSAKGRTLWIRTAAQPVLEGGRVVRVIGHIMDITERKQAEEKLRDSEEKYRGLFNESVVAVYVFDGNKNFVDSNQAGVDLLGYTREELLNMSIPDVYADRDVVLPAHTQLLSGVNVYNYEHKLRRKDGTIITVLNNSRPLTDDQGNVVGMQSTLLDITNRKRAEAALEEESQFRRALFQQSPDGILIIDPQTTRFLDFNTAAHQQLGYSREEFAELSIFDIEARETMEETKSQIANVIRNGKGDFETLQRTRRGEIRNVHVTAQYMDVQGHPVYYCIWRDITERKRAGEHMALMTRMLDDAPASITIYDTDGRFLYANRKTFAWHGYDEDEFMSINLHDLDVPGSEIPMLERIRRIVEVGEANFDVAHYRKDGSIFPLQVLAKLVQWQGKTAILSIASDITELKKAEEALRRTTELLNSVREAQSLYIEHGDPQAVFNALLQIIVKLTGSEFGYLDEVLHDSDGAIFKQNLALSNIAWDSESKALDKQPDARDLELHDVNNLAERQVVLKEPVISNDVQHDTHVSGFPPGCPPIHAFMNLPIRSGGDVVGVVGVANRCGGYDQEMAQFLEPYLNACAGIIEAVRLSTREHKAVMALHESEIQVRKKLDAVLQPEGDISELTLADIITTETVQELMDDLYHLTGFANALVDQNGKVLVATGWQDICTKFHRVHPETRRFCQESDTRLTLGVEPGTFNLYKCKNNMWDVSTPIMIGGEHVGNVFLGQFFFDDEEIDYELFRAQARKYGFNEDEYISALNRVPRWSRETVNSVMKFYSRFTAFVSTLSYGNLKLARTLEERKQAEEERVKLQQQLTQAQKMESVGRLAGGVAHDFNNMLGVILGHAEMASLQVDPALPIYSDLQEIRKAADRSANLTRQLLAFARKQTIIPKVLDLNETVAGMLKMLQRLIGEDIHLNWQPDMNLWPIKVDPSQIDQILANLCVNARDAITDIGVITIETGNRVLDEEFCENHAGYIPGEYVLLIFSDNGCGMGKETLDKLFEPFFTTKGQGKGTGLGLATVYGIVTQNNGFINVYSEPGQGTTFSIYMPRYEGKSEQLRMVGTTEVSRDHHETILLVEDEPAILIMTKKLLEKLGFKVLSASTPGEAFKVAADYTGTLHLLITDVIMPDMTGRELARSIQSLYPSIKCLFMSGYTADVIAHHGVLEEGVHFIPKPFSRDELINKVHEVLEEK